MDKSRVYGTMLALVLLASSVFLLTCVVGEVSQPHSLLTICVLGLSQILFTLFFLVMMEVN